MSWIRLQSDRVGAWVCIVLGALALLLGYLGVSGTPHVAEQLPYIVSGGLTGIFLLGLGGMLLLSADLSDEWRKLDDLDETLAKHGLRPLEAEADEASPAITTSLPVVASLTSKSRATAPVKRTPASRGRRDES